MLVRREHAKARLWSACRVQGQWVVGQVSRGAGWVECGVWGVGGASGVIWYQHVHVRRTQA